MENEIIEIKDSQNVEKNAENKIIGNIIKTLRRKSGLSLRDLAGSTGITAAYLSLIEQAKLNNPPADEILIKIAEALNMSDLEKKELLRLAALERTPQLIRLENERLRIENENYKREKMNELQESKKLDTDKLAESVSDKIENYRSQDGKMDTTYKKTFKREDGYEEMKVVVVDEDAIVMIDTSVKVLSPGRAVRVLKEKIGDIRDRESPLKERLELIELLKIVNRLIKEEDDEYSSAESKAMMKPHKTREEIELILKNIGI